MTVAELRKALAALPDDAPEWKLVEIIFNNPTAQASLALCRTIKATSDEFLWGKGNHRS